MNLKKEVNVVVRNLYGDFEKDDAGNLIISAKNFLERLEQWGLQCSYIAFLSISLLNSRLGLSIIIAPPRDWDTLERGCTTSNLFRSLYGYGNEKVYAIGDPPSLYRGTFHLKENRIEISNRYPHCIKSAFPERDLQELEIFKQEITQACGVSEITFLDFMPTQCRNCNGKGTEIVDMGGPDVEVTCHTCNGTGLESS